MSVTVLSNVYTPTLGATITGAAPSLTLSADSGDNGHVWMVIDSEGMDGDKSGTTVSNLSRASFKVNGSAVAAGHNTGATIYFVSAFEAMKACFATKFDEQSVSGGSTASFTIPASGSLPTGGSHIRIYWKAKTDQVTASNLLLRFNGDSTNVYSYQNTQMNGTSVTTAFTGTTSSIRIGVVADSAANIYNHGFIDIEDYAAVTRHSAQGTCHRNDASVTNNTGSETDTGLWVPAALAAATSITLLPSAGNFTTANFRTYVFP